MCCMLTLQRTKHNRGTTLPKRSWDLKSKIDAPQLALAADRWGVPGVLLGMWEWFTTFMELLKWVFVSVWIFGLCGLWQICSMIWIRTLRWRHNGRGGVSNHQPHHCLLNRLFRRRSKKTSKLRVTGLCVGNSPGTGEFPAQLAGNAENVSIWWRHHD